MFLMEDRETGIFNGAREKTTEGCRKVCWKGRRAVEMVKICKSVSSTPKILIRWLSVDPQELQRHNCSSGTRWESCKENRRSETSTGRDIDAGCKNEFKQINGRVDGKKSVVYLIKRWRLK